MNKNEVNIKLFLKLNVSRTDIEYLYSLVILGLRSETECQIRVTK